jgi:hypothetical protein
LLQDSTALAVLRDFDLVSTLVAVLVHELAEQITGDHLAGLEVELKNGLGVEALAPVLEHVELDLAVVVRDRDRDLELEEVTVRVAKVRHFFRSIWIAMHAVQGKRDPDF